MIQIQAIHIEEFRGIRTLDVRPEGDSFVIHGPNGSGKSGVVDAIDFALTGNIARLSGSGTGGLTVLRHGPHVARRDDPAAALVTLTLRDVDSGQSAKLTRRVKTANRFSLDPDLPEIRASIERAQQHPELTLSRREIIKFILAESGKRAQEVQALLKLDRLDEIRRLLKTAQSKSSGEETRSKSEVDAAEAAMRRHLDLPSLGATDVANKVNKQRVVLGLTQLPSLTLATDLTEGFEAEGSAATFDKTSALRDVDALVKRLPAPNALNQAVSDLREPLELLSRDPTILESLKRRSFIDAGLQLVLDAQCPLCDTPWPDAAALRNHLAAKLARSADAARLQGQVEASARAVVRELRGTAELVRAVLAHAVPYGTDGAVHRLRSWADDLTSFAGTLATAESTVEQEHRLTGDVLAMPSDVLDDLAALRTAINAEPDQSATAYARGFLAIAQDRWARIESARSNYSSAATAKTTANTVYRTYCKVADQALTALYKTVQEEFSGYYRAINADDEAAFKAELEPSSGKLDLLVDFYGVGLFPPGAYHSEGHQDGMGVCLYLALVKQLLAEDFTFAVLDDVVTSVDRDHRRQFCNLLRERFPGVQFIITTHDEIWAKQMQSSGLVRRARQIKFHGWSVEAGPSAEQGDDFWERIESDLARGDVPGAAHKLRRNLESIMGDLAEAIGAQVAYRADARYELGAMLNAVKSRHSSLLKKASNAANSWNDEQAKARVEALKQTRSAAVLAQDAENWSINALVHYNDWASMTKADFIPVVDAYKQFLALFSCSNPTCESWIHVVGPGGQEESLRCDCNTYALNLRSR